MKTQLIVPSIAAMGLALCGQSSFAMGEFFVDASAGVDIPGAGTPQTPYRTISFALASVGQGENIIRVAAGTYDAALGETFPISMSPLTSVIGEGVGKTILLGTGSEVLVEFGGQAFGPDTLFAGMSLESAKTGVVLESQSSDVGSPVLADLEITDMADFGVSVFGASATVEPLIQNCRFLRCDRGVAVTYSAGNGVTRIEDCRFDDCFLGVSLSGDGLDTQNSLSCIVERAELRGCTTGVRVRGGKSTATLRVLNTLIVNGGRGGEAAGSVDSSASLELVGCTVAGNNVGLFGAGLFGQSIIARNCIVWGNNADIDASHPSATTFDIEYSNLDPGSFQLAATNVDVNPQFSTVPGDFHLRSTSPLVDAGDPNQLPGGYDVDGDARLTDGNTDFDARVDMGYDEFNLVELSVGGLAQPGATLTIDVDAPAGWVYINILSVRTTDLDVGSLGSLLIGPNVVQTTAGVVPGSDPLQLPPAQSIVGIPLIFQAVAADFTTGLGSLSNFVATVIVE